jgi:endo-1,4-beta-D-glucanase Y
VKPCFAVILLAMLSTTASAVLEINNAQPKVHANEWKWVLDSTWQGLIRRNIKGCEGKSIYRNHNGASTGLLCRPKSETPYDAVSEGVGYGMLLALYANDQKTFDLLYGTSKEFYLNACAGWRKPADGGSTESGSASDADEDIALSLIFADKLQKKGIWGVSNINYANEAQGVVNCIWNYLRPDGGLPPGNAWDPGYNIGYFAPAWYRIYKDFDSQNRDWMKVVNRSYELIELSPAYDIGMVSDWSSHSGDPGGGGYNTYNDGKTFFKDAIRILWRIANDYIWFKEPKAKAFLDNSLAFINSKGGPSAANFYQLDGSNKGKLLPATDKWIDFNDRTNQNTWRYRSEHSHLTIGQWLTVAMAVGSNEDKIAWSDKMSEFYDWGKKVDFFGQATDRTGGIEDTLHNEMYFDQFLAWFGVSLMSGTWVNVVALLDNPVSNIEGIPGLPSEAKPSSSSADDSQSSSSLQNDLGSSSSLGNSGNSSSSGGTSPIAIPKAAKGPIRVTTTNELIMLENLPENANVEVYNLKGKLMHSAMAHGSISIPVQTKMYIVKIRHEKGTTIVLSKPYFSR